MHRHRITLLALLAVLGLPSAAGAATSFSYPDFAPPTGLTLNGTAATGPGGQLRLTPDLGGVAGSAFRTTAEVDDDESFATRFVVDVSGPQTEEQAGDGLAFVLQEEGPTALGDGGSAIGYGGITPSVAVELDTFVDDGLAPNEVAVTTNGMFATQLGQADIANVKGTMTWVWVEYDAPSTTLDVFVATSGLKPAAPTLTVALDLAAVLSGRRAHAGFTAGTGDASEVHDVVDWDFDGYGTDVACVEASVDPGQTTTCTATVTVESGATPTGQVTFTSASGTSFTPTSCTLAADAPLVADCSVTFAPGTTSTTRTVQVAYPGDGNALAGADAFDVVVRSAAPSGGGGGGSGATSGAASSSPPPAAPRQAPTATPVLERTVAVQEVSGTVTVTLANGQKVALGALQGIPVGSTVDATAGRVRLITAGAPGGPPQAAEFYEGAFVVTQDATGLVNLTLAGPTLRCGSGGRGTARTAQRGAKKRLWGDGKGKFRVSSKHSAAVVRGTKWLVEEACDGTTTTVEQGVVTVYDYAQGLVRQVSAGGRTFVEDNPLPRLGATVNLVPIGRDARLGGRRLRGLTQARAGRAIDATRSDVRVVAATTGAGAAIPEAGQLPTQWASFDSGRFTVRQDRSGLTDLKLTGPLDCGPSGGRARAAAARKRKLWGDGRGRFKVTGKHSAAVVRGTKWLVTDTCTSTETRVSRGIVAVEDLVRKVTVIVRAGGRYRATARRQQQ